MILEVISYRTLQTERIKTQSVKLVNNLNNVLLKGDISPDI